MSAESSQTEKGNKNLKLKNIKELWENYKSYNICLIAITGKENKE